MISRTAMNRRWAAAGLSLLLVLTPGYHVGTAAETGPLPSTTADTGHGGAPESKLARTLAETAQRSEMAGDKMVDVIVTLKGEAGTASRALGAAVGAEGHRSYTTLPFQTMRVPAKALHALASNESVRYVSPDSEVFGASRAARQTARVPGSTEELDTPNAVLRGAGVTVAIVDTGVAPHGDFYELAGQFDFLDGANGTPAIPSDPYGHGTHIAGLVGGDGRNSYSAKYQGASTQARVLALRALDGEGRGNLSNVLRALDWILTVGIDQFGVRVVNLSLGKGVEEAQALDPLVQAVEAVWDAGVVVVVSAGNHGTSGHQTITSPGNSRKVITVGSLTDRGTGTVYADDFVSSFSSRGPTLYDHVLKPDLLAPGNKVVAPHAQGARLGVLLPPERILCGFNGGGCSQKYLQLSGTSMAAGVVSGAVARMLQKDPSLSPSTVKARLMKTARKIPGDPTTTGAGVLNVEDAMNATGTVSGQALSPLMSLSDGGSVVYVQDPALLWGSEWSAGSLWPDGSLWADSANGFLWSTGSLWPDSSLWADAYLWTNGFLWTESVAPASVDIEDP